MPTLDDDLPDRWPPPPDDAVEALLAACLDRPVGERERAIDDACSSRPELAAELRARRDALASVGIEIDDEAPEYPEQLGDFRLVEHLGGGGMGVVYLAVQTSLGRDVALKLIRPEQLYFSGARARFRREAEAIARLQHPGIVPIYTVGEEGGIPYFAMERIRGTTLAEALGRLRARAPESLSGADLYALAAQAASADDRDAIATQTEPGSTFDGGWVETCLRIARQVAEALEHAHAHGLVHRDVKPSNVAVTPDGRALLFDFGLTSTGTSGDAGRPGREVTRPGATLGTLPYMSPEQIAGVRATDRRSDVYSLGITLYELLALQLPYRGEEARAIERAASAGRPDPLRVRNRRVGADVETVVLHAIDPDPARRYPTAADFARDLGNLLAHRPIEARPPGPIVRTRRWLERHPALGTALVLGPLLAVSAPTALYLAQRRHARELGETLAEVESSRNAARAESARAERAAGSAERALDFVLGIFTRASPTAGPDRVLSARDVVDLGARKAGLELADEPWAEARIRLVLGRVYTNLGAHAAALTELERALTLLRADGTPAARPYLAGTLLSLGEALADLGRGDEAESRLREALALWEETAAGAAGRSNTLHALSALASGAGRYEEAEGLLRESLKLAESAADGDALDRAKCRASLGGVLVAQVRHDEAADLLAAALAELESARGGDDPDVVRVAGNLAVARKGQGRLEEAQALYGDALARARREPEVSGETIGVLLANSAAVAEARGEFDSALDGYRESAALLATALAPDHPKTLHAEARQAALLSRCARYAEALDLYCELMPKLRSRFAAEHPLLGISLAGYAACAAARGDRVHAIDLYREGAAILRRIQAQEAAASRALCALADLVGSERPEEARAILADALELARTAADPGAERLVQERIARWSDHAASGAEPDDAGGEPKDRGAELRESTARRDR